MLNILRKNKVRKGIFWFIAVAVIATFAVSGVMISSDDKVTKGALAQYDKKNISVTDYLNSYRAVQHQFELFYGGRDVDRSRINFKGEAWDRILLLDHAKKEKINVSDKEVVEWITTQPAFKTKDKFDDVLYKMYIERGLRSTPRQFEEEIRQMLVIRKVTEKLKDSQALTDEKLKQLYTEQKSEKDILMATLPKNAFTSQVTSTDKDIDQLYEVVKDKLTSPEKVKLQYVFVPKDKAEPLKAALEDNASALQDLAKNFSLEIKETDFFSKNDTVDEFKAAPGVLALAFTAEAGSENNWVNADNGSYKVRISEKQAEHLMSKEEARAELIKMFADQKASELAVQKLKDLKAKMTGADDFEKILKEEKIEVTPLEKYKKGMYPAGIWPSENLEKFALPLKAGEISEPFDIPKGAMIVKVTNVHGFDEKTYEGDKEAFKAEISSKIQREELEKLLEKLREKLSLNLELLKDIFPADSDSKN